MRRWVVLVVVVVAIALLWTLRENERGVAASREVAARPSDERDRSGPSELIEPQAAPVAAPNEPDRRAAELADAREPDDGDVEESEEPPPNLLEVHVVAADGTPWAGGELRILAETSPVLPRFQPLFPPGAEGGDAQPWMSRFQVYERTTEEGVRCMYRTDDGGRAHIAGVTPDQPFQLVVVDELGGVGDRREEPPMVSSEVRRVEFHLSKLAASLSGTCLSEYGAPVDDVSVRVEGQGGALSRTTNARGHFTTGPLFAERVTLSADHDQFGTAQLVDVAPLAGPFELRLRTTRTLHVRLVGARGGRPQLQGMKLVTPAETYGAHTPREPDDDHVFWDAPRMPATLVLERPWPRRTLEVDADSESVTWTVPEVGWLEARVERIAAAEGEFLLMVHDPQDSEDSRQSFTLTNTGNQLVRAQLWEGEHVLQVLQVRDPESRDIVPWGAPIGIEIRGGETTYTTVGP